ncbi:MAG: uroporphyrinogen decarboxylase/cobalamine-independent methonine synthase family protein [Planctomycetota bacterium]|jgi:hypothetical protein
MTPETTDCPPPPDELIERHRAFWRRDPVDRPLLVEERGRPFFASVACMYGEEAGNPITPVQADAARYLRCIDWESAWAPGQADLLTVLPPNPRIPWLEAIAGCKVVPHPSSDSIWSGEPDSLPSRPSAIQPDKAWLDALIRQVDDLKTGAPASAPVTQTLMRGPGDVIEALIGSTRLVYAMMDDAGWLRSLIESVTDLFIRVARMQWERMTMVWGGHVNFFGLWSPEPCVRVQEDVQRILSPELYREWLRPALCRIVGEFPYSMFHMHSASLNMAGEIVTVPGLKGLQVSMDPPPYAPPITQQIVELQRVQERVPLLIEGPVSDDELDALRQALSPSGLALRR